MDEILLIAGMALVTFGIRFCLTRISGAGEFPPLLKKALAYVPPGVLTAIILPSILFPGGNVQTGLSLHNPYLIGGAGAVAVGFIFKNLLFTILFSMGLFLFWQWVLQSGWI